MSLTPGARLGPYEIVAPIGAGGMGEVFKARDTRLGRPVAIKIAAARFTERFEREARAVAALSHPNICTLYDVGPDYLVMEFIEGKPLKGPLPIETALRHAREIAAALDAAHRLHIVHRDLKPANILVTKGGIKLLDFGLAKMNAPAAVADATVTSALTQEGAILGTLQYMAPEQLEGKEADARSDIFAFGCVLYEMLTGRIAFHGDSQASIIAAILEREPQPLTGVPSAVARVIQRAMAKDPEERWQSARDLAVALDLAAATPDSVPQKPRTPKLALAALAIIALLATSAAIWFALRTSPETNWSGEPLGGPPGALGPRISPDGHTIAFQAMIDGQSQVGILKPETGNWTVLTHQKDLGSVGEIAWSRDGSKLYFDRNTDIPSGVYSVPLLGGEPRLVLESAGAPQVLADGSLVVCRVNAQRDQQLYRFWPESGKIEPLPALPNTTNVVVSRAMPDGRNIVFYGTRLDDKGARAGTGLFLLDPATRQTHQLAPQLVFQPASPPAFAGTPDGRSVIMSVSARSLVRVLEVPVDGSDKVRTLFTLSRRVWYLDAAPNGAIYADQLSEEQRLLRFLPTGAGVEQLTGAYSHEIGLAAVLRDGRPLIFTNAGDRRRLVLVEKNGTFSPLVESNEDCAPPVALLGEHHVAVTTDRNPVQLAIVSIADGRIVSHVSLKHTAIRSLTASPDGKTLYYTSGGFVWSMPVTGGDPSNLAPGDTVSFDAAANSLVVGVSEKEAIHLVRVPAKGGASTPIEARGGLRMPNGNLYGTAVGPDGRIAIQAYSVNQWNYLAGLIDPRTSQFTRIPLNFDGDIGAITWTPDGRLVALADTWSLSLWRMRP